MLWVVCYLRLRNALHWTPPPPGSGGGAGCGSAPHTHSSHCMYVLRCTVLRAHVCTHMYIHTDAMAMYGIHVCQRHTLGQCYPLPPPTCTEVPVSRLLRLRSCRMAPAFFRACLPRTADAMTVAACASAAACASRCSCLMPATRLRAFRPRLTRCTVVAARVSALACRVGWWW